MLLIGAKMQEYRKKQGLSQEEFAARVGVTRQAVSKWETDKALQAQFTSRANEAKEELMKLKNDKKKIDYYASVNPAGKVGGTLDSSF